MIVKTDPFNWDKMVKSDKTTLYIQDTTMLNDAQLKIEMAYDYTYYLNNIDHLGVQIFENDKIATEKYEIYDEHGIVRAYRRFDDNTEAFKGTIKMIVYYCYK